MQIVDFQFGEVEFAHLIRKRLVQSRPFRAVTRTTDGLLSHQGVPGLWLMMIYSPGNGLGAALGQLQVYGFDNLTGSEADQDQRQGDKSQQYRHEPAPEQAFQGKRLLKSTEIGFWFTRHGD